MSYTAHPATLAALANGQKLTARENDDGTWDVFNVLVFGECHRKGAPKVDRDWLAKAVQHSQEGALQGYSCPLVVRHTFRQDGTLDDKSTRAGSFVLREVTEGRDGKAVMTADFIRVSSDAYHRIKRGELPCVSVEVGSFADPRIAKIALLDTDEPFFKFPHITIGREITRDETRSISSYRAESEDAGDTDPVRGWLHVGPTHCYLFRGDLAMPEQDAADGLDTDNGATASDATHTGNDAAPAPAAAQFRTDDEALDALAQRLAPLVAACLAKAKSTDSDSDTDVAPVAPEDMTMSNQHSDQADPKAADASQATDTSAAGDVDLRKQFAALTATVDVLKQRDEERTAKAAAAARYDAAIGKLDGFHLTDKIKSSLRQFAESTDATMLDAYVETVKELAPHDGHDTLDDATRFADSSDDDLPQEVLAFRAQGPDAFEAARKAYAQFRACRKSGFRDVDFDLATFLETNLGSPAAK